MVDVPYIIDNPFRVEAEPEETQHDILVRCLYNTMQRAEGRNLIWAILGESGWGQEELSNDPYDLARMQGRQHVGHWLVNLLEQSDPTSFARMQLEVAKIEQQRRLKENTSEKE